MALSDYERYQLEWMIAHGYSLHDFVEALSNSGITRLSEDSFEVWEQDYGFGGEIYACEAEWRDAEGAEQGVSNQRYVVAALSADDLCEIYGDDISSSETADAIAAITAQRLGRVVKRALPHEIDAVMAEFDNLVQDGEKRGLEHEQAAKEARDKFASEYLPHISDTLVAGTMYLDVNGYDHRLRKTEDAPGATIGGPADKKPCVTLKYSTSLVEEAMAKNGIPLTQPNIAFMSDKIANAIWNDAMENASHIASETVLYWKYEVPDCARTTPAQVAQSAVAVSRDVGKDEAVIETQKRGR